MTNTEILTKAIEKAHANGWMWHYKDNKQFDLSCKWIAEYQMIPKNGAYRMIFDHDFAKAFFGTDKNCSSTCKSQIGLDSDCTCNAPEAWEQGLVDMVLEENPLEYLENYV